MEFILELVMLNVDIDYDVIVPLVCACRRLADVAESMPRSKSNIYGGQYIRGAYHGCFRYNTYGSCFDRYVRYVYGKEIMRVSFGPDANVRPAIVDIGSAVVDVSDQDIYIRMKTHTHAIMAGHDTPAGYDEVCRRAFGMNLAELRRAAGHI